jgi:hypothetical protein
MEDSLKGNELKSGPAKAAEIAMRDMPLRAADVSAIRSPTLLHQARMVRPRT